MSLRSFYIAPFVVCMVNAVALAQDDNPLRVAQDATAAHANDHEPERTVFVQDNTVEVLLAIATLISALGTFASVVCYYLTWIEISTQSRSLKKSINAISYASIEQGERELLQIAATDELFSAKYLHTLGLKVPEGTPASHCLIHICILSSVENVCFQYTNGSLPDSLWKGWKSFLSQLIKVDSIHLNWPVLRHWYMPELVEAVDTALEVSRQNSSESPQRSKT